MNAFSKPVCRGCFALGSACGHCERCEQDPMNPKNMARFEPRPVTLVLPYPISANRYWASRAYKPKGSKTWLCMTYVTKEAEQYKKIVKELAVLAGVAVPIDWRCDTTIDLYPHRPLDWQKRQHTHGEYWDDTVQCMDLGNCEKVLSDALQGIIFTDDKWIWDMRKRRMEPDSHGSRLVVTITPRVRVSKQVSLLGGCDGFVFSTTSLHPFGK